MIVNSAASRGIIRQFVPSLSHFLEDPALVFRLELLRKSTARLGKFLIVA